MMAAFFKLPFLLLAALFMSFYYVDSAPFDNTEVPIYLPLYFRAVTEDGESRQNNFLSNLGATFFNNLITSPAVTNIINTAINNTINNFVPLFVNNLISATLNATSGNNNRNSSNNSSTASPRTYVLPIEIDFEQPTPYLGGMYLPHPTQYVPLYYYAVSFQ